MTPAFDADRLTTPQAAAYIGVAEISLKIDRVTDRLGAIPFYRVGRLIYYRRSDLDKWLEDRRVQVRVPDPINLVCSTCSKPNSPQARDNICIYCGGQVVRR